MGRVSTKAIWKVSFFATKAIDDEHVYLRSKECRIAQNGMAAILDGGITMMFNKSIHSVCREDSFEAKTMFNVLAAGNKRGNVIDMNQVPGNSWSNAVSLDDLKLKAPDSP